MMMLMSGLETDIEALDAALQSFFRTMKRPQRWADITSHAGIAVDRPAAAILHTLILAEPKRLRVQDLADLLDIEAPSVTRKTQELEQDGYLWRLPDPADRRAISLHVTTRGRSVSKRLWKAQRDMMTQSLADWSAKDRRQFITLFERFSSELRVNHESRTTHKQGTK